MPSAETLATLLARGPVLPVVVVDDPARAVGLVRALAAGGVTTVEVTLRTARALDCVRAIRDALPEAVCGVGTVLDRRQLEAATAAGAAFAVSPGATPTLLDAAGDAGVPFLPGAATASEIMALRERGYRLVKLFPAEQAGGVAFLKALASPLADMRFCPTGGIGPANARAYLSLPNVACVGGSWLAPAEQVDAGDWAAITRLAHAASALAQPAS
jgi:2-dehydro-3-deoxyphosphogluconate aldolase/(4S)-4-hydroxy-2-oxoglutarate aldolase